MPLAQVRAIAINPDSLFCGKLMMLVIRATREGDGQMIRMYLGISGSVMLAAIVGCAMCDDCQDYTSPVVNSGVEGSPIYESSIYGSPVYKSVGGRSFTEESVVGEPVEASRASEAGSGSR